jgi:hypothetical protein
MSALDIAELENEVSQAAPPPVDAEPRKLTLRPPDEILAMQFDDSDIILGDRQLAKGQSLVMAGQGGLGKSRLLLQMAACQIVGSKFLTFDTGANHLRWLILQTENSNRRLKTDLARLQGWLGNVCDKFNSQVTIHTLENDLDGFVSLDSIENQLLLERTIDHTQPDIIVFDPLNDFAAGDLNKDADMRNTVQTLSQISRRGNPHRAIVILHHALTGRGGAMKATGYDRASFARNSKVLFAWTRGQINLAPVDPNNYDRLIVACGKCSNGKEFLPFAIRLNPETFIYECDPTVDVATWEREISGQADRGPLMTPARVGELCKALTSKADLAKVIMEDCGCVRGSAYRYIARATGRTIAHNKANETYSPK